MNKVTTKWSPGRLKEVRRLRDRFERIECLSMPSFEVACPTHFGGNDLDHWCSRCAILFLVADALDQPRV